MNQNNKIDQLFSQLRHTTDDAPMHLWPKVESAIAEAPKKEKKFFWFGFLGLLFLAVGSLLLYANRVQVSGGQQSKPFHTETKNAKTKIAEKADSDVLEITKNTESQNIILPKQLNEKQSNKRILVAPKVSAPIENLTINSEKKIQNLSVTPSHSGPRPKAVAHLDDEFLAFRKSQSNKKRALSGLAPKLKTMLSPLAQKELELPENSLVIFSPEEGCKGSRIIKVPKSIFMDAYVSPVFSNTFFTKRSSEIASYAKLRDSTERNGVGMLVGVRVGYIHESGLNLRAGLAYQQIRNKFQYTVEQDEKMIVQIYRDNTGNIIGRDTTYEYGRRKLDVTNKYTTVDLPISLGYISMKNKVQIGFHVGGVLNLSFSQSGVYLNENNRVVKLEDSDIYKNSIGASFFGSVELQYLLADHWGVFMEPQVRFYPASLTLATHPVKQNITAFNVLTGVKYIF